MNIQRTPDSESTRFDSIIHADSTSQKSQIDQKKDLSPVQSNCIVTLFKELSNFLERLFLNCLPCLGDTHDCAEMDPEISQKFAPLAQKTDRVEKGLIHVKAKHEERPPNLEAQHAEKLIKAGLPNKTGNTFSAAEKKEIKETVNQYAEKKFGSALTPESVKMLMETPSGEKLLKDCAKEMHMSENTSFLSAARNCMKEPTLQKFNKLFDDFVSTQSDAQINLNSQQFSNFKKDMEQLGEMQKQADAIRDSDPSQARELDDAIAKKIQSSVIPAKTEIEKLISVDLNLVSQMEKRIGPIF